MGPWIWIRRGSGIRIQRPLYLHTTSIRIRAACYAEIQSSSALRAVFETFGANETTLNTDWGSASGESSFSARVESPVDAIFFHLIGEEWRAKGVLLRNLTRWVAMESGVEPTTLMIMDPVVDIICVKTLLRGLIRRQ